MRIDEFEVWLQTRSGPFYTNDPWKCPLAQCLSEHHNFGVSVGAGTYLGRASAEYVMDDWMKRFVRAFDRGTPEVVDVDAVREALSKAKTQET